METITTLALPNGAAMRVEIGGLRRWCATDMCNAYKREAKAYLRHIKKPRKHGSILRIYADVLKLSSTQIVVTKDRGRLRSTWVHPSLALHLATWASHEFGAWANDKLTTFYKLDTEFTHVKEVATKALTSTPNEQQDEESVVRRKLAIRENGEEEVSTTSGRVDIVTAEEIIEVKRGRKWKHALGQVLAYGIDMPLKRKRIHLFDAEEELVKSAKRICTQFDVLVTYENCCEEENHHS
jgi:hypothetical protein